MNLNDVRLPDESYAFLYGIVILRTQCAHLVDSAAVNYVYALGTHTNGCTCSVHGGVSTTDNEAAVALLDNYLLAVEVALVVQAYAAKEPNGLTYALDVATRNLKLLRTARTCTHKYSVKALGEEVVDGIILADSSVAVDDNTQFLHLLNLSAHNIFRQTILWNTKHEHATGFRFHLENLHIESLTRKIACDSESGRT